MRIAYFSPFSPDKSGISDFSEELLPELAKHAKIDLYSNKPLEKREITNAFKVLNMNEYDRNSYDFSIFQIGNSYQFHKDIVEMFMKYPDILELHDISLHHYLAEGTFPDKNFDKYIEIMKYCHGKEGEKIARKFANGEFTESWEEQSAKFTVNKHLIDKAKAVIVHSDYAKQVVKGVRPDVPVVNIPLHTPEIIEDYDSHKEMCKKKIGVKKEVLTLGSFGYATDRKRIPSIIGALSIFKKETNKDFKYYIVGEVGNLDIEKMVKHYHLEENVVVTGFTSLEEFKMYMGACDICFNLRYPTQGESSASLHRIFGLGKPVLITAVGSFEEYSENLIIKIRHDSHEVWDIVEALKRLTAEKTEIKKRCQKAYEFAKENCDLVRNANKYADFLHHIAANSYQDDYIEHYLDKLQSLDLLDEFYIRKKLGLLSMF